MKFISFSKYFSFTNIIAGLIAILVGALFKFSSLPYFILEFLHINPNEMNEYIFSGFIVMITRLGIKGVVEEMITPYLEIIINKININQMNIADLLNPDSPSPGQAGDGNHQGNSRPGQAGNDNNQGNFQYIMRQNGFFIAPDGTVTVYDPTNVGSRGLFRGGQFSNESSQPYAKNLSKALNEYKGFCIKWNLDYDMDLSKSPHISKQDISFIEEACYHARKDKEVY